MTKGAVNLVVAFHNLDFGRKWGEHLKDIRRILRTEVVGRKVDILGLVELRKYLKVLFRLKYKVIQPERIGGDTGSEAILIRRKSKLNILGHGSRPASKTNLGERIGLRRFVWVVVDTDGRDPVGHIFVHFPPLRMQDGGLDEIYDRNLQNLIDWLKVTYDCSIAVYGDFNKLSRSDPGGLKFKYDAKWLGSRIDLVALLDGAKKKLYATKFILDPKRMDHHPVIYVAYN